MRRAADAPPARCVSEPSDASLAQAGYVVGALMTRDHAHHGERLADSCRAHSLPLALYELPCVHRSISRAGSDDLRCTKSRFVEFLLDRYACPVLYVDVDCRFARRPERLDQLRAAQVDFAIFNWLAEEHTEAYVPVAIAPGTQPTAIGRAPRFYRFSHSIDFMSETQLLCSGPVQWWTPTDAARALLNEWQAVIRRAPNSPDDKCLDFAYNNVMSGRLRVDWLEKRYARYAWWIYESPVIDHPQQPASGRGFTPLEQLDGTPRIHRDALREHAVPPVFPRDCLIDVEARRLLRLEQQQWRDAGPVSVPLWL